MKKLLLALIAAAVLSLGCATPNITTPELTLPSHIQHIEDVTNGMDGPSIKIIDYRDDGYTLWLWIDNSDIPGECDYVGVLLIVDKAQNQYEPLFIFNEQTAENPCQDAYDAYDGYLEEMKKMPKEGI